MIKIYFPLFLLLSVAACSQAPAPAVTREPSSPMASARQAGPGEYQVKPGDTLYRIAREHGMTPTELAGLNNIDNPAMLQVGQILRLRPTGAVAAVTAAAPEVTAVPVGVAGGVETRSLDGSPAPAAKPAGASVHEPRGGKEPYSEEANARLNAPVAPAASAAPAAVPAPAPAAATAAAPAVSPAESTASVAGVTWAWPTAAKIKAAYNGSSNKGIDFAGSQGDAVHAAGDGRVLFAGNGPQGYGKLVIIKHNTDLLSVYAHNSKLLVKEGQAVKLGQKISEMGSSGTDSVKLHFEIRRQGLPVDPGPFLPKR